MFSLLPLLCFIPYVLGLGQKATISFDANANSLALASNGSAVQIIADPADWPAVLRVANDLTLDFGRVTGTNGSLTLMGGSGHYNVTAHDAGAAFRESPHNASFIFNVTDMSTFERPTYGRKGGVVIAGTIGNSSLIDRLISAGKIDISAVQASWEAFVATVVPDPMPGIASALVIAGKSARLTILD